MDSRFVFCAILFEDFVVLKTSNQDSGIAGITCYKMHSEQCAVQMNSNAHQYVKKILCRASLDKSLSALLHTI